MTSGGPILHIIIGTTASGKEGLALEIASRLGGEIVSVDSMKIYRGLDIATAKAAPADRQRVKHHCLDLVEPSETFSAADFVKAADTAIADIVARGRTPILSGGTAFYFKALLDGLFDGPGADPGIRARLEAEAAADGVESLHRRLAAHDPAAAAKIHPADLRRLVRALEVMELTGEAISSRQREWAGFHDATANTANSHAFFQNPRYRFTMVRIVRERDDVHRRVRERVARMAESGLKEEAARVFQQRHSLARTPLQAVGYKELFPYFAGASAWEDALERLCLNTNKLVRSQDTWFRKFPAVAVLAGSRDNSETLADRVCTLR